MTFDCCNNCARREIGCHGKCEEYLKARAKRDLINLCRRKRDQRYPDHVTFHKGMNKKGDPTKNINRYKRKT